MGCWLTFWPPQTAFEPANADWGTWLLMGYFRTIPFELEECALIDGATRWQILIKIRSEERRVGKEC